MSRASLVYWASVAFHGALAAGVVSIKGTRVRETIGISVFESKRKTTPSPEVVPPPPPVAKEAPRPTAKAKVAPPPQEKAVPKEAAPPAAAPASVPDFGLSLGNDGALGGSGLAVPAGTVGTESHGERGDRPDKTTRRVLAAAAPSACDEPLKKPKVITIGRPAYTPAAAAAQVAGRVRVELTVDASGRVTKARVLEGLGHGLDEAAVETARAATFEAGTKCGKPVPATFIIAIRFSP